MRGAPWWAVAVLLSFGAGRALAAQGGDPVCSLSAASGIVADNLSELHPITGDFRWYIATLDGPGGQQIDYFKPTATTWTVLFSSQGPGLYRGGLLTTVDNNKGPAKFTELATSCSL